MLGYIYIACLLYICILLELLDDVAVAVWLLGIATSVKWFFFLSSITISGRLLWTDQLLWTCHSKFYNTLLLLLLLLFYVFFTFHMCLRITRGC